MGRYDYAAMPSSANNPCIPCPTYHDAKGKVGYPFQNEEDSAGIPYIPRGQPTTGSA